MQPDKREERVGGAAKRHYEGNAEHHHQIRIAGIGEGEDVQAVRHGDQDEDGKDAGHPPDLNRHGADGPGDWLCCLHLGWRAAAVRNGPVVSVLNVRDGDEVMLMTAQGMVVRSPVDQIREAGRATQGVRLMKLADDDRIVAVARVIPEGAEPGAEGEEAPEGDAPAPAAGA